jgi:acyl transferase domain-containing protein
MTANPPMTRPPIAVVGVSALFPGSTDSTGFWNDILSGADRMTDVPATHWLIDDHYDADPATPDKTYGRRGGFLDPVAFDALRFGVPPSVVPSTDTAQLLALIVAQRVLDDAVRGQFTELDRSRASVILGVTSGQELFGAMASRMNRPMWLQGMRRAGIAEDVAQEACDRILALHPEWTESTFPGLLGNVVAGRIANRLDLGGTNCVTDAACASSFSAISMGINELYLGDSDLVIAGGVDTMNDIFMFMCFSKTPALSKSEDIRPFSDQADGTMLGEGIGMVALKRLDDAERDGNDIYCIVNGVGASSDGRSKSVYAPVSYGQARALDNAYAKTGYGPGTVELVEAHGTGTVAGDAAEFGGLELAFNASERADRQWCALGSVKSQIGHTKAAAGAAGLFKIVMALHHKVLPQTAKIERPNPELNLVNSPFHLNTRTRPWVRGSDHERRGSVSSFGFGGSNFHIALSEYVGTATRAPRLRTADAELVVLCGTDGADIIDQARAHIASASVDGYLAFAAQTSQRGYTAGVPVRLAVTANDEADLAVKLDQAATRIASDPTASFSTPTGIHYGTSPNPGDVAFIFPGQGSQYLFMGAQLAMTFSEAMDAWDLAADHDWDGTALHDAVFPKTSFEEDADHASQALLTATHWAQPAIGTTSLGLLRVLRAIGLDAQHVAGHSFGEITALHAAGVLSETDLVGVAARRGTLMAEAAQTPGSMTAVTGAIDSVRDVVDRSSADVVIANHNSHRQVVLSGPTAAIEQVEAELHAAGVSAKRLPVATAFHSAVVSGASAAFADFLDDVTFNAPVVPVHSNETTLPYPNEDPAAMRAQLARQLSRPVRFVEMIEAMYKSGARTFIEVGPSAVLTGLIDDILDGREHRAVPLDKKGRSGLAAFFDGLGQLVAAGIDMNLGALWREYGEMNDPHAAERPKLALAISGTNYDNPYPPQDLRDLAAANPMSTNSATANSVTANSVNSVTAPPPTASQTTAETALAQPVDGTPQLQETAPVLSAAGPATTQSALPDAGVLAAYQHAQAQTAAAHTAYLNTMAQAHRAFLDAAQQGIAVLGRLAGASIAAAPYDAVAATPLTPAPVAAPPLAPVAAAAPQPEAPVAPISSAPPTAARSAVVEPAVVTTTNAEFATPAAASASAPVLAGSSAVQTSPEAMTPLLLGVVSDRTGYPTEMLNMDMELESDLGIDSIKRVEILSAMQDLVPDLPDVDLAAMARLATLGEIVDYLNLQLAGPEPAPATTPVTIQADVPAAAPAVSASGAVATDDLLPGSFGRFIVRPSPTAVTGTPSTGLFDGTIVVTDDEGGIAPALVAALTERGVDAVIESVDAPVPHTGLIYLGNLRNTPDVDAALALNRNAFDAAHEFASGGPAGGLFVAVDDQHGSFGYDNSDAKRSWAGGISALSRTAAIEWPAATVKMIDIERASRTPNEIAAALADELLQGGADAEIGLRADGSRITLQTVRVDVEHGALPIGRSDVVVVSGGGRGVTAATTIELARASSATFVLLGRSPLDDSPEQYGATADAALKQLLLDEAKAAGETLTPQQLNARFDRILANREISATIAAIENAGGRATYLAVDITDLDGVEHALETVRNEVGPITGVIHGAGVLADKLIVDKTPEQFESVFATKVRGLKNLLAATADDALNVLCVFSSVAARTGNTGQADYAMANEVLGKVAINERARRGDACLVKALCWGPWAGGMVTPSLKQHFESIGVELIGIDAGTRMFADELASPQTDQVEVVLGGGVLSPVRLTESAEKQPAQQVNA